MNESIKNLLSLNNKALQFAHDVDGFDFEKPYFIAESADRFTVNTVKKAVAEAMNPAKCKIVLFVVPGVHCYKSGLYYAILSSGKFDGTRRTRFELSIELPIQREALKNYHNERSRVSAELRGLRTAIDLILTVSNYGGEVTPGNRRLIEGILA